MLASSVALAALSAAAMGGRTSKMIAHDKLHGGPGLLPRVLTGLGLQRGPAWRASQWAANVVAGVSKFDAVRKL
jgi:hypothetical protein